jgi:hypothetical protein
MRQKPDTRTLMKLKARIRNSFPNRVRMLIQEYVQWSKRRFSAPSPHFIKQACLARNGVPGASWVETGTYLGQTTQVLSTLAPHVYSIEPESTLFANASKYFSDTPNVEILLGTSEDILPALLPKLNGDINFWLDGHYSAGPTFKGSQDTPILNELQCIEDNLDHFGKICVLIDDIRLFALPDRNYSGYPSIDVLVDWSTKLHLDWHIEHDIFVARN